MATVKCVFCGKEYSEHPEKRSPKERLERHLLNEHYAELVSAGAAGSSAPRVELEDFLIPGQLRFDFWGFCE